MKTSLLLILTIVTLTVYGRSNPSDQSCNKDTLKAQLKLIEVQFTPDCGTIAWIVAQKFELLQEGKSLEPTRYIVVLQQCPELLGRTFFIKGEIYEAILSKATKEQNAAGRNQYKNEKLPTYWCHVISRSLK